MNLETFMEAARGYAGLGWSVQEQLGTLTEIADGSYTLDEAYDDGKLNANAVKMIREFVTGLRHDLDDESWEYGGWARLLEVIDEYQGVNA